MIRYEKYNPEAAHRAVVEELMREYSTPEPPGPGFPTLPMPYRTPENQAELLTLLDPERPEFDSPLAIFSGLGATERRTLAELAQQIREAADAETRHVASEGLRAALQSMGFPDDWIKQVVPATRQPQGKMKMELPKGGPPKHGEPTKHEYHASWCRFYTSPESDADGNQGSFMD